MLGTVEAERDADGLDDDGEEARRGAAVDPAGSMIPAERPRAGTAGPRGRPRPRGTPRGTAPPPPPGLLPRREPAARVDRRAAPAPRGTGRPWSRSSGAPAPRRPRRPRRPRGPTCRRTPAPRTASAPRPGSPPGCRASRAGVRVGWWMPRPHRTARGVPPREYAAARPGGEVPPPARRPQGALAAESRGMTNQTLPPRSAPTPDHDPTRTAPVRSRVPRPQLPPAPQPARGVPVRARRWVLRRTRSPAPWTPREASPATTPTRSGPSSASRRRPARRRAPAS